MKITFPRVGVAAFAASILLITSAFAGDPTGSWKWTWTPPAGGTGGGTPREVVMKLTAQDGKLTGTVSGRQNDTAISEGTIKDDVIAFNVSRDRNGQTIVIKYSGKLEGDTIKGTIEGVDRDGQPTKRDWLATRVKEEAAPATEAPPATQ
jgi:hypothetical protein